MTGQVSSYNINTYRGRIFVREYRRPIHFILDEEARSPAAIEAITDSLVNNAMGNHQGAGAIEFESFLNISRTGRIRSLRIVDVS